MPKTEPVQESSELCWQAISQWDNEGGALASMRNERVADIYEMTNVELVHLRIRIIALENLMIAVLAEGSDRQLEVAREMAAYISPRPGFAQHSLTIDAAAHMIDFVERAIFLRTKRAQ